MTSPTDTQAPAKTTRRGRRRHPQDTLADPGPVSTNDKRCSRPGCKRPLPPDPPQHAFCGIICRSAARELETSQRISAAIGHPELADAAAELNAAITKYYRLSSQVFEAAREVGITVDQWRAIRDGTAKGPTA